jgi:hypothetical protein
MLACKTGACVVPVGIKNADRFTKLAPLEVTFGAPLFPPKDVRRDDYQILTDEVMTRIKDLCLVP